MKIEIKGMSIESVELKDLEPLQGNLKILTDKNYQKLKKSFQEKGMFVPIFVWRNGGKYKIIDGHGRERLFLNEKAEFQKDGKKTTKIPCLVIEAEDLKDAKEKVLLISSQFQTITQEGFDEFTFDLDEEWLKEMVNFDALRLDDYFPPEDNKPIDEDKMAETSNECPRCHFKW